MVGSVSGPAMRGCRVKSRSRYCRRALRGTKGFFRDGSSARPRRSPRLSHPGILAIFDFGSHDGLAYAVTELLEGETLRSASASGRCRLERRRGATPSKSRAVSLRRTTKGSSTATSSPRTSYVTRDGRIKILDFGLARFGRGADRRQRHANSDARRADFPARCSEPWVTCRPSRCAAPRPMQTFGYLLARLRAPRDAHGNARLRQGHRRRDDDGDLARGSRGARRSSPVSGALRSDPGSLPE